MSTASAPRNIQNDTQMKIQALVFDFDGLIVDTETPEFAAWQAVFAARGCELPLATWVLNIGTRGVVDPYALLAEQLGAPVERETVRGQVRAHYDALIQDQQLLPGVGDYLEAARQAGIQLAVASSSRHDWVDPHLHAHGIRDYFAEVVCADDVTEVKPDPELYRLALRRLDRAPAQAIALEDSPNGVLAAKAAGMYCVFVPNAVTAHLTAAGADLQLTSLAQMPLAALVATILPAV
ncbi:MAG: HAD family hydrolase [Litorilinea sp.]